MIHYTDRVVDPPICFRSLIHPKIPIMNIGIDCRLPTYQMGGISQYTIHLIQALGELAGEDHYKIFHSIKEGRTFLPNETYGFSRSNLLTPCHHRLERYALALELVNHRLEVFHSPDFIPPSFGAARRIITVHDLTFLYFPELLTPQSRRYYSGQIEWAVKSADHIIADSEATRVDLIDLLGVYPQKVTTIHLAANPIFAQIYNDHDIQQTTKSYDVGKGFILAVGTLEPRKNIPVLLHAYKRLRNDFNISVPLVLVGMKGWLYESIFQLISDLELVEHVIHLGGVSDVQLAHLYRAAAVFAFPSRYEGFGLPALEAMHGGCPVVASNRGSLPEVVGEAGILLEPDDVDSWTQTLYLVLTQNELSDQLRKAGFDQARIFTWEKTAAATQDIYENREVG